MDIQSHPYCSLFQLVERTSTWTQSVEFVFFFYKPQCNTQQCQDASYSLSLKVRPCKNIPLGRGLWVGGGEVRLDRGSRLCRDCGFSPAPWINGVGQVRVPRGRVAGHRPPTCLPLPSPTAASSHPPDPRQPPRRHKSAYCSGAGRSASVTFITRNQHFSMSI